MSRKMSSFVAVLAILGFLTAGFVEARPLAVPAATPSSLAGALLHWMSSGLATVLNKDGIGLDPNGTKHQRSDRADGSGRHAVKVAVEGK